MKQLGFEFMKEISKEVDIELLIQVNKGGKSENDNLTTK